MGSLQTPLPAYVPRLLSRAEYDRARKAFYRRTGMARDDGLLPKPCPPGYTAVARVTGTAAPNVVDAAGRAVARTTPRYVLGDPAGDTCVRTEDHVEVDEPVRLEPVPPQLVPRPRPAGAPLRLGPAPWGYDEIPQPPRAVPDAVRFVAILANPRAQNFRPRSPDGTLGPSQLADWYPTPPRPELVGAWAILDDARHGRALGRRDGVAIQPLADEDWYDTPWGRELAVTFVPPLLPFLNQQWVPSQLVTLDAPADVLVPVDDYFVASPRFTERPTSLTVIHSAQAPETLAVARVESAAFAIPTLPPGQYNSTIGERRLPDGWAAWYAHEARRTDWERFSDSFEDFARSVARSAAARGLVMAVGSVLTAGAGAPALASILSAAASATGGLSSVAVDALVREGATNLTPQLRLGLRPGLAEYLGQPVAERAVSGAVSAAVDHAPWLAPEETNRVLQQAAEIAARYDFLGTIYTMSFNELVVQAERSRRKRDELRLLLAEIQARMANERWVVVARAAYKALETAVLAASGIGGAVLAVRAGLELAASAAKVGLQMLQAGELARSAERDARRRAADQQAADDAAIRALEEELARLRAELGALNGQRSAAGLRPVEPSWLDRLSPGEKLAGAVAGAVAVAAVLRRLW